MQGPGLQEQKLPEQDPPAQGHSPERPQFAQQVTVPPQPSEAVPAHWFEGQGSGFGTHVPPSPGPASPPAAPAPPPLGAVPPLPPFPPPGPPRS